MGFNSDPKWNLPRFYVYAWYSDDDILPVYIGKGAGNRAFRNKSVRVEFLDSGLTHKEALRLESKYISHFDQMGAKLWNIAGTHKTESKPTQVERKARKVHIEFTLPDNEIDPALYSQLFDLLSKLEATNICVKSFQQKVDADRPLTKIALQRLKHSETGRNFLSPLFSSLAETTPMTVSQIATVLNLSDGAVASYIRILGKYFGDHPELPASNVLITNYTEPKTYSIPKGIKDSFNQL